MATKQIAEHPKGGTGKGGRTAGGRADERAKRRAEGWQRELAMCRKAGWMLNPEQPIDFADVSDPERGLVGFVVTASGEVRVSGDRNWSPDTEDPVVARFLAPAVVPLIRPLIDMAAAESGLPRASLRAGGELRSRAVQEAHLAGRAAFADVIGPPAYRVSYSIVRTDCRAVRVVRGYHADRLNGLSGNPGHASFLNLVAQVAATYLRCQPAEVAVELSQEVQAEAAGDSDGVSFPTAPLPL